MCNIDIINSEMYANGYDACCETQCLINICDRVAFKLLHDKLVEYFIRNVRPNVRP